MYPNIGVKTLINSWKKVNETFHKMNKKQRELDLFSYQHCYHFNNFFMFSYPIVILFIATNLIFSSECLNVNGNTKNNLGEDGLAIRTKFDLTCLSCIGSRANNTCTKAFQKNLTRRGIDYRCRIYERNGMVVAQGVVPKMLCTREAKSRINGRTTGNLVGEGRIWVGCCNSDNCNTGYCDAIGKDNTECNTTVGWIKPTTTTTMSTESISTSSLNSREATTPGRTQNMKATTEITNKQNVVQNDDPNRQVEFLGKLNNKETQKKSAPLKAAADDTDANAEAEAEPRTEPEPEGNRATSEVIFNHHYGIILFTCVTLVTTLSQMTLNE